MPNEKRTLNTTEAAEILGVKPHSVMVFIRRGSIQATLNKRQYEIELDEVLRYQREKRVQDRPDSVESFWQHVDKSAGPDGCWLWTGTLFNDGYGQHRYYLASVEERQSMLAHRFAWELENGSIADGMCVCHKCDNRRCVNTAHHFLGTTAENNIDRHIKGRDGKPRNKAKAIANRREGLREYFKRKKQTA